MFLIQVAFLVAVVEAYPTYAVENQACTLVEIGCGHLKTRDDRYMYLYNIPGVSDIAVYDNTGTAIANYGGNKPMEIDKNEVVTMNISSITLYKCQSLKMNFIYSDATQQKAGTESNGEEPSVKEGCSHYIVTAFVEKNEVVTTALLNSTIISDGDNPDTNHGDTSLTWKIIVGIVVPLMLVIAGLLFCVYKPWRDKQRNQGHRDVEEGQGNPEPNSIPLMQNERRDSRDIRKPDDGETVEAVVVLSDQGGEPGEESRQPMDNEETGADNPLLNGDVSGQGEEGLLGMEDGKPSDNDRADTASCQKTHADSPPLNVPKVVRVNSQTDDPQLLGQPQSNGRVPYRRESHLTNGAPGQGAGETSPLLCRSPGEEGVLEGQDRKSADSGGTYLESCQKTHAELPLVNGHHDVRVNDETKEPTPDAQSPGPPQMNGGPPMSNRAAEETTALLDKQSLDQVTKPPELIDKGPNDMESRRGEL